MKFTGLKYSYFKGIPILLSLFLIAPLIGCGGGGGGGSEADINTTDSDTGNTTIQISDLADTWQIYFTNEGENIEAPVKYLYFYIDDDKLTSLSVYEGSVVSNDIDISGAEISFNYQESDQSLYLSGTFDASTMSGEWFDNYSDISGTWRAKKGFQVEKLTPVLYEQGDTVMDLVQGDGSVLATFYGTTDKTTDGALINRFVVQIDNEDLEITLDQKEQITKMSDSTISMNVTHNTDQSFNFDLFSNGSIIYSGSNLNYENINSFWIENSPANDDIIIKKKANLKSAFISEGASPPIKMRVAVDIIKYDLHQTYYHYIFKKVIASDNFSMKAGFEKHLRNNNEYSKLLRDISVLMILQAKHFKNVKEKCKDFYYPEECENRHNKLGKKLNLYVQLLGRVAIEVIAKTFLQYNGAECTDSDGDLYEAPKNCGTKEDCKDNNKYVNPAAIEICNDDIDNDCDGSTDCDDPTCVDDADCKSSVSDCSEEYDKYHEMEMTLNRYCGFGSEGGLICSRYGFSGCANACVTVSTSAIGVFNAYACSSYPGYVSCASGAFTAYVDCLEGCNATFLNGKWGTEHGKELYTLHYVCAPKCDLQIKQVLDTQCVAK